MGYYINTVNGQPLPAKFKSDSILEKVTGSRIISPPQQFQEDLVCVVNNGPFEAAAYCYNQQEMDAFLYPDGRMKTWLIVPGAAELSLYK